MTLTVFVSFSRSIQWNYLPSYYSKKVNVNQRCRRRPSISMIIIACIEWKITRRFLCLKVINTYSNHSYDHKSVIHWQYRWVIVLLINSMYKFLHDHDYSIECIIFLSSFVRSPPPIVEDYWNLMFEYLCFAVLLQSIRTTDRTWRRTTVTFQTFLLRFFL